VTTPTNDNTPNYTFNTNEAGTITYSGSCTSATTNAVIGNNTITMNSLADGTYSNCGIRVTDASNNPSTVLAVNTFTVDTAAPTITNIASSTTATTATITWATNENSDTQIEYGLTTAYGSSTTLSSTMVTSHSQTIIGLNSSSLYHYRVKSKDALGNLATSIDKTFTTSNVPNITAPVISNGAPTGAQPAGTTQVTLAVTTDENATCKYSTTVGTSYSLMTNAFTTTSSTTHLVLITGLTNGISYTYYIRCQDQANNSNVTDYTIAFSIASPSASVGGGSSGGSSSGGGGGGGTASTPVPTPSATTVEMPSGADINKLNSEKNVIVLGDSIDLTKYKNLASLSSPEVEILSSDDAEQIFNYNKSVPLNANTKRLYLFIVARSTEKLDEQEKYALAYYIHYGSQTTKWLGAGERTGVLNSYLTAFGDLPTNEEQWQDVIKIANGRWPEEKSAKAEKNAQDKYFMLVYKRQPNMKEAKDNAAVTVIAYGLRPASRNMNSEKNAILIFKAIFKKAPVDAVEWDIVRAISYSGAKR
jgi:hypothetical protein